MWKSQVYPNNPCSFPRERDKYYNLQHNDTNIYSLQSEAFENDLFSFDITMIDENRKYNSQFH